MTNAVKYFSDVNGSTVELAGCWPMRNAEFAVRFPGVKGRRYDGFSMKVGAPAGVPSVDRFAQPITRVLTYKSHPSRHECDARCMNATGRTMNCECSCGGKNHGRGAFNCSEAA